MRTSDGRELDIDRFNDCISPSAVTDAAECLGTLDLHVQAEYQPNDRYWAFQWIESGVYIALCGLLTAFALWRIRQSLV